MTKINENEIEENQIYVMFSISTPCVFQNFQGKLSLGFQLDF